MKYNKDLGEDYTIKKDGRVLKASGPRAMQLKAAMKAQESETVHILKEQVKDLMEIVASGKSGNVVPSGYSADEVDKEINKAVETAIIETEKKSKETIADLEEELKYVKAEFKKYRNNYNAEAMKELENNVTSLRVKVESKDEIIETLKSATGTADISELVSSLTNKVDAIANSALDGKEFIDDPDRPRIETQFVDPLDAAVESTLEPHVVIDEEKGIENGGNINHKVNKLKDILGK